MCGFWQRANESSLTSSQLGLHDLASCTCTMSAASTGPTEAGHKKSAEGLDPACLVIRQAGKPICVQAGALASAHTLVTECPALQLFSVTLGLSAVCTRLQARALAGSQDWEALDAYSQERKLPIPLDTFVTVAKGHNAPKPVLARCACCCQPLDCTGHYHSLFALAGPFVCGTRNVPCHLRCVLDA